MEIGGKKLNFKPVFTMRASKRIKMELMKLGEELDEWRMGEEMDDAKLDELDKKWQETAKVLFVETDLPTLDEIGEEGLYAVTTGFFTRYLPATK